MQNQEKNKKSIFMHKIIIFHCINAYIMIKYTNILFIEGGAKYEFCIFISKFSKNIL